VAPPGSMELVGGFNFHRGCLALAARPAPPPTLADLALDAPGLGPGPGQGPKIVLALEAIANADNVGSIFRNAAAFGVHAVILDGRSCDPLYRKATRTSMGATLAVPFAVADEWSAALDTLRRAGYALVALTPAADAIDIADAANAPELAGRRLALLVGSEGAGLDDQTLARADFRVAIRMAAGVDSLNVATATGIALHRFARLQ
jgi:tRNA G18 (ribose-2'-O)-methylase SpoU